jgi:hypothetical protein
MLFLSFDIASRSLAYTIMYYNPDVLSVISNNINRFNDTETVNNVEFILRNNVDLRLCDVSDINEGLTNKEVNVLAKTKKLKYILTTIQTILDNFKEELQIKNPLVETKVVVLLEYQMSSNYQANAIFNKIYYHFVDYNPEIISPCYKNKIYFSDDLTYDKFTVKYKNTYSANKSHTKANFLYFVESFGLKERIKHIKKKNVDDAADSFMQIFAYINYYLKKSHIH